MKLLVAIVQEDDAGSVMDALVKARLSATRIASTGGFLREGSAAIFVGVEDGAVPRALDLFDANCRRRATTLPPDLHAPLQEWSLPETVTVEVGGAIVFVLDVARFERF